MVLIDLKPGGSKVQRRIGFGVAALLIGAVVILTVIVVPQFWTQKPAESAAIEERQIVVELLDRIEKETPSLATQTAPLRQRINTLNDSTVTVESQSQEITLRDDKLTLTRQFFDSDSFSQKSDLQKILQPNRVSGK